MVRALSVKLTEYRTLSFRVSVNSPYNTLTGPFRWRDGSGPDASFSIPDGERGASRRLVCGWRCATNCEPVTVCVGPFECLVFPSPESLPSD